MYELWCRFLQQHVNGKISYLPVMTSRDDGGKVFVKGMEIVAKQSFKYLHLVINLKKRP